MNPSRKIFSVALAALVAAGSSGCATQTRRYAVNETRQTVAGFSEEDINDTVPRAIQSICAQDRIKVREGENRAIVIVEDVTNDAELLSKIFQATAQQASAKAEGGI
jgi:hypothetical protein